MSATSASPKAASDMAFSTKPPSACALSMSSTAKLNDLAWSISNARVASVSCS
jgi:hypothetical protein